jgi:hypothetical protein
VAWSAGGSPFERVLAPLPPSALAYAGLRISVTKGVIASRTNQAVAAVTVKVVNPSAAWVRMEGAHWQLRLADGKVYTQPFSEGVEPKSTTERVLRFPVPMTAGWTTASLRVAEIGREPATLALDGEAPAPYVNLLPNGEHASTTGPAMTFTILAAAEDFEGPGERALLGKRYLHLSVRITSLDADIADQFIPEFLRLSVDGDPFTAEHLSENNILAAHSSQDVTMAVLIPATATHVVLEVGKPDIQKVATIPLDLTSGKA